MNRKVIWLWRICKSAALSILLMLAFGQMQMYLQMKESQLIIKVGFPLPYFWFSHDDDQLSGAKIDGAIIDFCLTFSVVLLFSWLFGIAQKQLSKSGKQSETIDL